LSERATAPAGVKVTIDDRQVEAPPGTLLVDAAATIGIEIPIFCYEPRLGPPIGACRMCLVEIEGMHGLQTACSTPVMPDMVVRTNSAPAVEAQDGVLELLLANHPLDCPVCDKGGECPLQDRTFKFGPGQTRFSEPKRHFPKPLDLSPLVAIDRERCIACYRCVRFSQEVAEDRQLTFQERGAGMEVATFTGDPYIGRFTGNIIDLCPVGALTSIPYRFVSRPWEIQNAPSVCGACPVGCNNELTQRDGQIKRVTGRQEPNFAVEEGWLCDKGRWGYAAAWSADRITRPIVRDGGTEREVSLEDGIDAAALILSRAAAPGFLVGPAATVEEAFLAQALAASLPGGRTGRLGIPGEALAPLRSLPGAQLGDLDTADVVVVVGGDVANHQPVVELRIRKAARHRATVVVVGPRAQDLSDRASNAVRTPPGQLVIGLGTVAKALQDAKNPIVLWDEADLANEPDAATELARLIETAGARQIELGADVNGAGLRALGIRTDELLPAIEAQKVGTLVTVHADPLTAAGATRWSTSLHKAGPLIALATHRSATTDRADVVLPALMHHEQEGVLVSLANRAQRLRPAARGPESAAAAWEILIALSHRAGKPLPYRTPTQAFAGAAEACPAFAGQTDASLGALGQVIAVPSTPVPAVPSRHREPDGEGLLLVTTTEIFGDALTYQSDALAAVRTPARLRLAPGQATALGVSAGQRARVTSPYGSCELDVAIDDHLPGGAAFVTTGPPAAGAGALRPDDSGPVRVTVEAAAG
jgi:NADH-quinone oxidoreductase subunit G